MGCAWNARNGCPSDGVLAGQDGAVVAYSNGNAAIGGQRIQVLVGDAGGLLPSLGVCAVNDFALRACCNEFGKTKLGSVQICGEARGNGFPSVNLGCTEHTATIAHGYICKFVGIGGQVCVAAVGQSSGVACIQVGTGGPDIACQARRS